jgi:hypothetical protein
MSAFCCASCHIYNAVAMASLGISGSTVATYCSSALAWALAVAWAQEAGTHVCNAVPASRAMFRRTGAQVS